MKMRFWKGAVKSETTRNVWGASTAMSVLAAVAVAVVVHFIPGDFWSIDLGPIAGLDGLTIRQAAVAVLGALATGFASRGLTFARQPHKAERAERKVRRRRGERVLPK